MLNSFNIKMFFFIGKNVLSSLMNKRKYLLLVFVYFTLQFNYDLILNKIN